MTALKKDKGTLRQAGLRATSARLAVLRLMRETLAPMTHAEACQALDEELWDKATVYRNLTDLAEAGLLRRISLSDGYRFELASHHHGDSPAHFVCSECEEVQCLPSIDLKPPKRAKLPESMRRGDVEIQIRGICDRCVS